MGLYKIKIDYITGGSFSTEEETDYLELEWDNLQIAKDNLKRIKEHYSLYSELNNWKNKKNKQQILEKYKDKDWFVYEPNYIMYYHENGKEGSDAISKEKWDKLKKEGKRVGIEIKEDAEYCMKLYADNGNVFQLSCFWIGYFETLLSVEIVLCNGKDEDDMKIEF